MGGRDREVVGSPEGSEGREGVGGSDARDWGGRVARGGGKEGVGRGGGGGPPVVAPLVAPLPPPATAHPPPAAWPVVVVAVVVVVVVARLIVIIVVVVAVASGGAGKEEGREVGERRPFGRGPSAPSRHRTSAARGPARRRGRRGCHCRCGPARRRRHPRGPAAADPASQPTPERHHTCPRAAARRTRAPPPARSGMSSAASAPPLPACRRHRSATAPSLRLDLEEGEGEGEGGGHAVGGDEKEIEMTDECSGWVGENWY
ncbi:hypothetical protein DAI22_11g130001 [Oryza sativa Japonica Group]|nr:hypothetical protein DAI22_11g130001 [Oryza sativa Japonica Group]